MNAHVELPGTNGSQGPTEQAYGGLQDAFDYFNEHLFENTLPRPIFVLARKKRTFGYFNPDRFVSSTGTKTSEIGLNPMYFASRSVEDTLAVLVHQMVHLWQAHFGTPGRHSYHNAEWSAKIKSIGLQPTDGEGKEVGEQIGQFIIDGGEYQRVCGEFLTTRQGIVWFDVISETPCELWGVNFLVPEVDSNETADPDQPPTDATNASYPVSAPLLVQPQARSLSQKTDSGIDPTPNDIQAEIKPATSVAVRPTLHKSEPPVLANEQIGEIIKQAVTTHNQQKKPTRERYTCPKCGMKAWAKFSANLICGDCNEKMVGEAVNTPASEDGSGQEDE